MPSKRTLPPVGSISRRTQRPAVVLPEPDSPTRPTILLRGTAKLTPSTALTTAPPFGGEVLLEVLDDEQRRCAGERS